MSTLAELIEPGSILDMSQSQLDSLISTIRERRNRVIKNRSLAHNRSRNTKSPDLGAKLAKLATRLDKSVADLNTRLDKAERLVSEMVALRLELGDATPSELASELNAARDIPLENGQAQEQTQPRTNLDLASSDEDRSGDEGDEEGGEAQEDDVDDEVSGSQERPRFNLLEASTPSPQDEEDIDESL
jgi:hypothetical protein